MDLLRSLNPSLLESFKTGALGLDIDKVQILTEYYVSFGVGPVEVDTVLSYLNNTNIVLEKHMDKAFKKSGFNRFKSSEEDYILVQKLQRDIVLNGTWPTLDELHFSRAKKLGMVKTPWDAAIIIHGEHVRTIPDSAITTIL